MGGGREREYLSLSPSLLQPARLARLGKDMKTPDHVVLSDTPHENCSHFPPHAPPLQQDPNPSGQTALLKTYLSLSPENVLRSLLRAELGACAAASLALRLRNNGT